MKRMSFLFLLIIGFASFTYYFNHSNFEYLGDYKMKKVNEIEWFLLGPGTYITDDKYVIFYKDKKIKYEYSYNKPSYSDFSFLKYKKDIKELSEYDFKKIRDTKMYYKEHPYFYKDYHSFNFTNNEFIKNNSEFNIVPENYSLIDKYILESRDTLISKIEYYKYLLQNEITFTNEQYDSLTREELIERLIELDNKIKENKIKN